MATSRPMRWGLIGLVVAAVTVGLGAAGLHVGAKALKSKVEQALGPESEIGEIRLGWNAVEVHRLRIKAPPGWPSEDTLRAQRVLVFPDLRGLLSAKVRVSRIVIEEGYVSALRSADGRLRVVPNLLETRTERTKSAPVPELGIGSIDLRNGVLEFFDATVRKPAFRIRLEQLQATASDIQLPQLKGHTRLQLDGVLKGVRRDGKISIDGWIEFASRDSAITNKLRGVDLIALQPYLLKAAEAGVKKGSLDLDLQSTVKSNRLRAPGTITLRGLDLESGGNSFMGLPRAAVVGFLKDRNDQITVKFVLEGNLDDPQFKLNEDFSTRVAASLGDTVGVSLEGIARGAGTVGQKGLEAVGGAVEGVGKSLKGLFGN